jgi:hypothetical protein
MTIRVQTEEMQEENDFVAMHKLVNYWIQLCGSEELLWKKAYEGILKSTFPAHRHIYCCASPLQLGQ